MNDHVEVILRKLEFNYEECAQDPAFRLLEPLLLSINEENILSPEEVESLEFAQVAGLEEDILLKLVEHGIDEDILEIEESDIDYLQKKFRHCESSIWDNTVSILRKERGSLAKIVRELKEKHDCANINTHVKTSEEYWRHMDVELQQLFQELKELDSVNNNSENVQIFKNFSASYEKELNNFIDYITEFVGNTWSGVINGNCNEDSENSPALCSQMCQSLEMMEQLTELETRLTFLHFKKILKAGENGLSAVVENSVIQSNPPLATVVCDSAQLRKYEKYVLNLSNMRAQLQIKEKVILQIFELTKVQRESWLETCTNLLHVLKEQRVLLDLVSVVQCLQRQESNIIRELLSDCYEHLQQEVANMSARIKYFEVTRDKFENYLSNKKTKQNILPEELEKFFTKYFPMEKQCFEDTITDHEKELQLSLEQQKMSIKNSKKKFSEVDKIVAELEININSIMESLSQIEEAFNEGANLLQTQKDNELRLRTWSSEDPAVTILRLWWVYFLTDIDKLKEIKDETESCPEGNSPSSPSFVNKYPCFTSTPKGDD